MTGTAAAVLAIALTAEIAAVAGPAAAAPAVPAPAPPAGSAFTLVAASGAEPAVADLASAVALAAQRGEPVEVAERTTEFERHVANPDGTVTLEAAVTPQRVRVDEAWAPVDPTLARAGGRVRPEATLLDLSLSSGGVDPLLELVDGERRLSLSWPAPLPEPELSGDTATYRDVLPEVDLVVRAEAESFAMALVVRSRRAAAHPALERVAWQVAADGLALRLTDDGAVEARDDATGEVVFAAPPSMMWDAPVPRESPLAGLAGQPGEAPARHPASTGPGAMARMPVEIAGAELAVLPDPRVLAGPETRYPVWIDPSFSRAITNWAPVFSSRPNDSWPSGTSQPRDAIRAGNLDWPDCGSWCGRWRSHLRFSISELSGEQLIGNPTFRVLLTHSASCNATPVSLWRTASIGSSGNVTWNSGDWLTNFGTRSGNANKAGGCGDSPQPDMNLEWSTSTIRSRLQSAMDSGNSTFTFGLRASTESDRSQWKTFARGSGRLIATYNSAPLTPDRLALDSDCLQCDSPAVVRSARPWLEARVRDPHGAPLRAEFQVRTTAGSVVTSGSVNSVSSGGTARWRPPSSSLSEGQTYRFRVRAHNQHLTSSWSGNFSFTVDTTPPPTPQVSSALYQHKDTATWNGGAGQAAPFSFDPAGAGDVIEFRYRWLDGAETVVPVGAGDPAEDVLIAPPGDLEQVLEVRAVDHAGNISGWRAYPMLVRPQPADAGYWKFDEGQGSAAAPAVGDPAYTGTLRGSAGWAVSGINPSDPGASGAAVSLDGAGHVEMPRPLATNHAAGFSISAWVNPASLSVPATVVSQNGSSATMARLLYQPTANGGQGGWCFEVRHGDGSALTSAACASQTPQTGTWTHLAGSYDAPAGQIRLWVDGGPNNGEPTPGAVAETAAPAAWAATGTFTVGAGLGLDHLTGRIDEVRVHQRVLTEFEVQHTFLQCRYALCPQVVAPSDPVLVGRWDLDEGSGALAADASGAGNDATGHGVPGWTTSGVGGTPAAALDGEDDYFETSGPVLLTDQSFTVSAWVRIAELPSSGNRNVVGQDGERMSPFRLYYHASSGAWRFLMRAADQAGADTGEWISRVDGPPAEIGRWTHLTGAYDAAAGQMRFYVDGELTGVTDHSAVWQASGPFAIGRILYTNSSSPDAPFLSSHFPGDIDAVRAYQSVLSSVDVATLYAEEAGLEPVGRWRLDEGTGGTAADSSGNDHHASLQGGAAWTEGYDGAPAVSLDGQSGHLLTAGPVLRTDESFTVAAWARIAALPSGDRGVVAQYGDEISAFRLQYRATTGQWCMTGRPEDQLGAAFRHACGPAPVPGVWTHLTGVYAASAGELRMYVNGQLVAVRVDVDLWHADGPLLIGLRSLLDGGAGHFPGEIDHVAAYQAALNTPQVAHLYDTQAPPPDLAGSWDFDEGTGAAVADGSGEGHHASLQGSAGWNPDGRDGTPAGSFDGQSGHALTVGPVLRTDESFTVAGWARLSQLPGANVTVVGQSGEYMSPFRIQYRSTTGRWRFLMRTADLPEAHTGEWITAVDGPLAQAGEWAHLAAVYDAVVREMRFYVDGALVGVEPFDAGWHAAGPFTIGSMLHTSTSDPENPSQRFFFPGEIDTVRAYQTALTGTQIWDLYVGTDP